MNAKTWGRKDGKGAGSKHYQCISEIVPTQLVGQDRVIVVVHEQAPPLRILDLGTLRLYGSYSDAHERAPGERAVLQLLKDRQDSVDAEGGDGAVDGEAIVGSGQRDQGCMAGLRGDDDKRELGDHGEEVEALIWAKLVVFREGTISKDQAAQSARDSTGGWDELDAVLVGAEDGGFIIEE